MLFDRICCSTVEKSVNWRCGKAKKGRSHSDEKTGFTSCIPRRLAACAQRDVCGGGRSHGDDTEVAREGGGSVSSVLSMQKAATLVAMGKTSRARMQDVGCR